MGFWTNYDPLTCDQGYKSIVPNVNGYVVPAGEAFGDMLLHIKALLVESSNFVSIAGNAEAGNKSAGQYEVVAWAGTNNQQQMIFRFARQLAVLHQIISLLLAVILDIPHLRICLINLVHMVLDRMNFSHTLIMTVVT